MKLLPYAELHCLSNFSFLRGASFPEELVERAIEFGYTALAITDECSLAGVVRAHIAARDSALKLVIGSEFICDDGLHFVLLATSRKGYAQLSHLITQARGKAVKGSYHLTLAMLQQHSCSECLALWIPDIGCEFTADMDLPGQKQHLLNIRPLFPQRLWIAVELLQLGNDRPRLQWLQELGAQWQIPLCASGGITMHKPERRLLRDTLTAIRLGTTLDALGAAIPANGQQHLRSRAQLQQLYPDTLLRESAHIASLCNFSLAELRYEYPHELVPAAHTPQSWLRCLVEQGMHTRWPDGVARKVRNTVERELALIAELRYEHFFLTVHDLVQFARSRNILCQGRGSAANSAVCYCLGITAVDPARMHLLFERFLSRERDEPPDIDVDFEHERREEVIQYIYTKYGRHRAALAATVICYRWRSAVRDVGKTLGIPLTVIEQLLKKVDFGNGNSTQQLQDKQIDIDQGTAERLFYLIKNLLGFPRHLSQHVGGFVISEGPLSELVPIENAAMPERTIIQWEKDDLEALGLLKVDVLALGMLTAIRKALQLVNASTGQQLALHSIPAEDANVYDMMCAADTVGVFQIESRAQMSMLPRLKPRSYYDLVIQIAIVRPGPIQGDMVHPYLARRSGREAVVYPSEGVRAVLERTLGIPIFQEQVMQIAIVAAGFSGGEADQLRRAMAAWKRKGGLEPFKEKLLIGMRERGYSEGFALQIYNQIKGFGDYGFPESHSASFALLAYVSSWLKCHYPAAFTCALLNSQPMGFYAPAQLVQDLRRHQVAVLPVDVNISEVDCSLELVDGELGVRLGLCMVAGLSLQVADTIVAQRKQAVFQSSNDFMARTGVGKRDSEALAAADALSSLAGDRYRAFWQVGVYQPALPMAAGSGQESGAESVGQTLDLLLPKPDEGQNIIADYLSTGLTLRRHPLALLRQHLDSYKVASAETLLAAGGDYFVKVVGVTTCRQRPQTAAGVTFLTLEDETGFINVVVWPTIAEKYRYAVNHGMLIGVVGTLQKSEGVTHVIARELADLSNWLEDMQLRSRNFF